MGLSVCAAGGGVNRVRKKRRTESDGSYLISAKIATRSMHVLRTNHPPRTVDRTTFIRSSMTLDLPAELWTQIFDLAADEDILFIHALPTSFGESVWWRDHTGRWRLRSPQQAMNLLQARSYATKKVFTNLLGSTCSELTFP